MEFSKIGSRDLRYRGSVLAPGRLADGCGAEPMSGIDKHDSHSAIDRGINLIDTAPVYGFGRSEEIVGKALAEGGLRNRAISRPRSGWTGAEGSRSATPALANLQGDRGVAQKAEDRRHRYLPSPLAGSRHADRARPRPRWPRFTSREKFARSASATFRRRR